MRARVLVFGILGQSPYAGIAWQVLHYLEGLRRLGYDVYYVEDTGAWPYDAARNEISGDAGYTVSYLAKVLGGYGFGDRWAYRSPSGDYLGFDEHQVVELLADANALINLTGSTLLRDEHLRVPVRVYLETDPGLPQFELANRRPFTVDLLGAHTHHFSFGEGIGLPSCGLPEVAIDYQPTRQPVVIDWWASESSHQRTAFTTVASWKQREKDVQWDGEVYRWSKHYEFLKFIDLPRRSGRTMELALSGVDGEAKRLLLNHGWNVVDAFALTQDAEPYREYIRTSRAEFTVAKDQNIRLKTGWFSDRSACYLAAGKPVITQDTGFGDFLPTGYGLFAFTTMDDVLGAMEAIESRYEENSEAAREIAREHFHAERVVGSLMERAGC